MGHSKTLLPSESSSKPSAKVRNTWLGPIHRTKTCSAAAPAGENPSHKPQARALESPPMLPLPPARTPTMERCRNRHCRRGAAALLFGLRRPGAVSPRVIVAPEDLARPVQPAGFFFATKPDSGRTDGGRRGSRRGYRATSLWGHPNKNPGTTRSTTEPWRRRDSEKPPQRATPPRHHAPPLTDFRTSARPRVTAPGIQGRIDHYAQQQPKLFR